MVAGHFYYPMYHLYILRCADGTLYTGITVDLSRRVQEHNAGNLGAKYTRARRPVKLVYSKKFRKRSTASRAEYQVKKLSRQEKLHLIQRAQ
jgi:putative endonuclease